VHGATRRKKTGEKRGHREQQTRTDQRVLKTEKLILLRSAAAGLRRDKKLKPEEDDIIAAKIVADVSAKVRRRANFGSSSMAFRSLSFWPRACS